MNLDLNEIRQQIDEIDSSIVDMFEKRMELCKNVALYKIENGTLETVKNIFNHKPFYHN